MSLDADDVTRLRGLGDPLDMKEIEDVYLPISRLLNYYVGAISSLHDVTSEFLGEQPPRTPFVIGVAGSVAVGKSTTSRILRELLSHWPDTPRVQLVTTDGFLFPNAELERRNIMARKGFPESYDRRELMRFVAAVKSGVPEVTAPVYSHLTYDIVPDDRIVVRNPDVLIVEGLNVLQPPSARYDGSVGVAVNDYFDFTVYVDAEARTWSAGTSSGSSASGRPRSPTRTRTSTGMRCSPTSRRRPPPLGSGGRSTGRTSSRTSSRRGPAPPWCSSRARTTAWRRFGSASSEPLRRQRLSGQKLSTSRSTASAPRRRRECRRPA